MDFRFQSLLDLAKLQMQDLPLSAVIQVLERGLERVRPPLGRVRSARSLDRFGREFRPARDGAGFANPDDKHSSASNTRPGVCRAARLRH